MTDILLALVILACLVVFSGVAALMLGLDNRAERRELERDARATARAIIRINEEAETQILRQLAAARSRRRR